MSNLSGFFNHKWIRIIFALKLAIVGTVLIYEMPWVSLGEKPGIAEDKPNKKDAPQKNEGSKKDSASKIEKSGSYLDGIFQLPDLMPEKITKAELAKYVKLAERAKQEAIDRTTTLKKQASKLVELEKSIEEKLSKLDDEKRFFLGSVQKEKTLQEDRLKDLVELYGKMDPKKAAPIFEKMDRDLVVGLFQKLTKKQITKVLEVMQPDKALEVSEYFGRVKSGSEYDILKSMNESLLQAFSDQCKKIDDQSSVTPEKATPNKI